jgi:hypothetical protein
MMNEIEQIAPGRRPHLPRGIHVAQPTERMTQAEECIRVARMARWELEPYMGAPPLPRSKAFSRPGWDTTPAPLPDPQVFPATNLLASLLACFWLAGCRPHDFPQYPPNYREYAYVTNGGSGTVTVSTW